MKLIWFIAHTFMECPDSDLKWFKDKEATCLKCGRTYFNFTR